MRFRTPELILGAFLTVAVFAMGMLFSSSLYPSEPPKVYVLEKSEGHAKASLGFWEKTKDDPVAAFNLVLAIATVVLATSTVLLWWSNSGKAGFAKRKKQKFCNEAIREF